MMSEAFFADRCMSQRRAVVRRLQPHRRKEVEVDCLTGSRVHLRAVKYPRIGFPRPIIGTTAGRPVAARSLGGAVRVPILLR